MITGYPSLALDAADSPSVSYLVRHGQVCYDYQGHLQILYDAESIRFATAGGTTPPNPTPTPAPPLLLPVTIQSLPAAGYPVKEGTMKRIYSLITCFVLLTLVTGTTIVRAQRQAPEGSSKTQAATPADLTFDHFFLQNYFTSTAWWDSHTIVDGSGGVHLAFYDETIIYYAHCAANCGDPANWLVLPLYDAGMLASMAEPTLGVDASGRPRLIWYANYGGDKNYFYAECNDHCTDSTANWTSGAVLSTADYYLPSPIKVRYAALDTQGRPRLVYRMVGDTDDGFYYLTCDAGCTTASNWYSIAVTTPGLHPNVFQLVFDPNDRPRVLGYDNNSSALVYAECNSSCSTAANWGSVGLFGPFTIRWI